MSTGIFQTGELERPEKRTTHDALRDTRRQREAWQRVRNAERQYAAQLRKVSSQIGTIVGAFPADDPQRIDEMIQTLHRYSDMLGPWARAVARRMLYEVSRRDERAWLQYAKLMGEEIRLQLQRAPLAMVYHSLMEQQVTLITSIPREAANRVHTLATEALYEGGRASQIAKAIEESQGVAKSRANLIARTEVGRASTTFQQARATAIGSTHYIWRTARDQRVRVRHRKLEGQVFAWNDPPITAEDGSRSLPGATFNCRCVAEPILPKLY